MMGLGQTEFHDRLREAQGLRVFIGNSKRKCDSNPPFPFLSLFLEIFSAAKTISPKSESMAFAGSLFRVFWFLQFFIKERWAVMITRPQTASFFFVALCVLFILDKNRMTLSPSQLFIGLYTQFH